jgi:hypothetical protein
MVARLGGRHLFGQNAKGVPAGRLGAPSQRRQCEANAREMRFRRSPREPHRSGP